MKKTILLVIAVLFAGCLGSSVKGDPDRIHKQHPLVIGSSRFAFSLFNQLLRSEQGNVFVSPMGLYLALGMTHTGAAGKTAREISRTLGIPWEEAGNTSAAYGDLIRYLERSAGNAELAIANALLAQQRYVFLKPFLERCGAYFGAPVQRVGFGSGQAQKRVNAWVEKKTGGKIRKILSRPIPGSTRMLLVNSIYFKGKWKKTFPRRDTRQDYFYPRGGAAVRVPMMRVRSRFSYMTDDRVQAVVLPYKKSDLGMGIVLPRKGVTNVFSRFTLESLHQVMDAMRQQKGRVILPRYRMEYGVKELQPVLQALGIRAAFDITGADFSRMNGNRELHVKAVLHKALVEVDEEGTVAAAATDVRVGIKSACPERLFVFNANRPFLFFIMDLKKRVILFLGVMRNPEGR